MTQSEECRFEAIVAPHFDALYRTAYRLTRSRDDAEDLVQEVCLKACGRIAELADVANARAWLMRVQYRLFIDGRRRRQRSPLRAVADGADLDALAAGGPGPDELAEQGRIERRVAAAWHGLEPDQRALLALHVEGHSLSELEAITGVSKNALSARLHRARARLAKLMGHTIGGCAEPTRMES
jgi:RNA polymerase sigma factor (sigma-70 family)